MSQKHKKDVPTLTQLDEINQLLKSARRKSNRTVNNYFSSEKSIAYLSVFTLVILSLSMKQGRGHKLPIPRKWLGNGRHPDPNYVIQNQLVQLSNYSLAVIRLVEDGLDNPARTVLRSVVELSVQLLILSSSAEDMKLYVSSAEPERAKEIWYELFAKKGRAKKKIRALEARFGLSETLTKMVEEDREKLLKVHNMAVHHSFFATVVGANSPDVEDEDFFSFTAFGKATSASRRTLNELNETLFYTLLMFRKIILSIHKFKAPRKDRGWLLSLIMMESVIQCLVGAEPSGPR